MLVRVPKFTSIHESEGASIAMDSATKPPDPTEPERTEPERTEPERIVGSDRVLAVLVELAQHPSGTTLDDLSRYLKSSKPTVHRALASLRRAGLANQSARGTYELGDEFLRLAYEYQDQRPESARIEPVLRALATQYGETAHYAVLDGSEIVYRAKVDPSHGAVRLTSTIGGRNPAYRTAVGKLLLSSVIESESDLNHWLGSTRLEPRTSNTIVSVSALYRELQLTVERGYGIDNEENEIGVNCVALGVRLEAGPKQSGAVSISGLTYRCPLPTLTNAVPAIRATLDEYLGSA
ncbi:MAG: transcriptional regulator, IclR family [Glaciihabitans sp.]|nr:transcriptional regulator, IclR family [Glaciihabitans sp.]